MHLYRNVHTCMWTVEGAISGIPPWQLLWRQQKFNRPILPFPDTVTDTWPACGVSEISSAQREAAFFSSMSLSSQFKPSSSQRSTLCSIPAHPLDNIFFSGALFVPPHLSPGPSHSSSRSPAVRRGVIYPCPMCAELFNILSSAETVLHVHIKHCCFICRFLLLWSGG